MTAGPYRPIRLVTYASRLLDVHVHASVSAAPGLAARLAVSIDLDGHKHTEETLARGSGYIADEREGQGQNNQDATILVKQYRVALETLDGKTIREEIRFAERSSQTTIQLVNWDIDGRVQLWWPVGYGEQKLYKVIVEILDQVRLHIFYLEDLRHVLIHT
jgi:beta-mannosidase